MPTSADAKTTAKVQVRVDRKKVFFMVPPPTVCALRATVRAFY